MVMRRAIKTVAEVLLACTLGLSCLVGTALAASGIEIEQTCSLTVYFGKEDAGFAGVSYRLYRVAEVTEDAAFTPTEAFAGYPVTFDGLDSSGWRALSQTLAGYAARDGLEPDGVAETAKDGNASFVALPVGLYLVSGEQHEEDGFLYTPEPFLICLPDRGEGEDHWNYDAAASCKFDSETALDTSSVERKVVKVWKDAGREQRRPQQIAVQLLKDGAVYDTVTLSEANGWQHVWEKLDADAQWQVTERCTPDGYVVSVSREQTTFTMTNTYQEKDDTPRLPQTGMLWWPVPLLAGAGMLLFFAGWMRRRSHEK